MEAADATTLVTYERGAITLELDGREVQVSPFRAAAAQHMGVGRTDEIDELAPIPEEAQE